MSRLGNAGKGRPRASYIGGADIAAIAGASPYKTPFEVYISKVTQEEAPLNPAMEWGLRLESAVAQKYSDATRHLLSQPKAIFHKEHGFIGGTPDYLSTDDPNLLLEVKTADERQLDLLDGNGVPIWGMDGSDLVPLQYLVQCQWYMGLTGRRRADLAVFFLGSSRDFRIYSLNFDVDLYTALVKKAVGFWNGYVAPRVEPPLDGSGGLIAEYLCRKALAQGKDLDAAEWPEILSYAAALERASRIRKELEGMEEGYKAALLSLMAEAGASKIKGNLDGGNFTVSIHGGGHGKEIIDWQAVAMALAKGGIPQELIEANTVRGRAKRPYLRTYFDAVRKARAAAQKQPLAEISA